jgi:hypothetical protein
MSAPFIGPNCLGSPREDDLLIFDGLTGGAGYVRASSLDFGSAAWNEITLPGIPFDGFRSALIAGNPAFVERRNERDLLYWRAADREGLNWGKPYPLGNETAAGDRQLVDAGGKPGVIYSDTVSGKLLYTVAAEAEGVAWSKPRVIAHYPGEFIVGTVDGRPCVLAVNRLTEGLEFIWAANESGTLWTGVQQIEGLELGTATDIAPRSIADVFGHAACAVFIEIGPSEFSELFFIYK